MSADGFLMVQAKSPQTRSPGVFRIFFTTSPARAFLVLGSLVLAGFAEGIGYATVLPALTIFVGDSAGAKPSWLQTSITSVLNLFHIPTNSLGILLLFAMAAITIKNLLLIWSSNFVGYEVARVATGLRLKLIDSLLGVRWSYFTRQPVGRFANAVSNEAARAAEAYSASATLMANLVQAAFGVILTLLVSWQPGTLSLLVSAIISYVLRPVVRM